MPRADYVNCRICGRHRDDVGELSHQRLCGFCAPARFEANLIALKTMNGPFAHHWRHRLAASVGAVIPTKT